MLYCFHVRLISDIETGYLLKNGTYNIEDTPYYFDEKGRSHGLATDFYTDGIGTRYFLNGILQKGR